MKFGVITAVTENNDNNNNKLWRERERERERERNPVTRTNMDAKALLNQKNYILKAKRITAVEFVFI